MTLFLVYLDTLDFSMFSTEKNIQRFGNKIDVLHEYLRYFRDFIASALQKSKFTYRLKSFCVDNVSLRHTDSDRLVSFTFFDFYPAIDNM